MFEIEGSFMRFHVPGLPHTVTNRKYIHCAFTQKVFKLCKMLHSMGHEVYHYGCEGSNPTCTEHIDVVEEKFRRKFYPDDWHDKHWNYNIYDECHKVFYKNAIKAINKRKGRRDFFLASWGFGHKQIADALGNTVLTIEPGIGYKDTFCRYRVFESYNWMSHVYGRGMLNDQGQLVTKEDGSYFDAVIPNYFEPEDFDFTPDKEDYFLYLGRVIKRKGIETIIAIAQETGIHVKLAGQGKYPIPPSKGEIIEHTGFADADKRRGLFSKAKGLLMPTVYIEPFGGVSIESMMSGTPVICTDWGVFPETILHGITGYRCRSLDQFSWAVRNIENISPQVCRDYALANFSLERVAAMYQEYFEMVYSLWDKKGWYSVNSKRENMSWLERYYPAEIPNSKTREIVTTQIDSIVYPEEKEPDYVLDLNWYKKKKKPGISFIMRAKNEQSTIGLAIDSLKQLNVPYEINLVFNQCTDNTEYEVNSHWKNGRLDQTINFYHYPFQLGKTGLENQCTPVTSVHSTIWLLNWIMMKGNYEYTFRWDSDFIMTSALARDVEKAVADNEKIVNISAIFSDTGKANTEPYFWSNYLVPRYTRYSVWHLTQFAITPTKAVTLDGKIIHDSPLKMKKDYWKTEPWWEKEEREETQELRKKANEKYELLKKQIGKDCTIGARASCPDSEDLARRIQKIVGADSDEIPALKEYASRIR